MRRFLSLTAFLLTLTLLPVQAQEKTVILGGDTIAITVNYEGVYVSGMYDFEVKGETLSAAKEGTVQVGDRIIESNGRAVTSLEELFANLKTLQKERNQVPVTVIRNGQREAASLFVCYLESEKVFKTGLYVKDKIKGVGTMTFYDPSTKTFAALGHEIAEEGQSHPADVTMGQIFEATVVSVRRSTSGNPGEKICQSESLVPIGTVSKNTIYGLYGKVQTLPSAAQSIPVASREEVTVGPAEIYTVIQGTTPKRYTIQITEVRKQNGQAVNQFVTNILFMLAIFFLGFSLAGIPLIGFIVFTKGVQIGFSCVLYVLTYQLKGVLGILLTLIPQILFDLIALFLVSVISTEISYALIQRCLGYSRSDFSLIQLINSRLNVLIVSLLLIFFSAWIKSTLVIRLMEIFAMME